MKKIFLSISDQCNLDCSFCYVYPKKNSVLNVDAFLKWYTRFQTGVTIDNIKIHFHGGEPTLHANDILKIIKNTTAKYEIWTNLTYELTSKIKDLLSLCTVFTSWDPIHLRFKTQENFELWKNNCRQIRPKRIGVLLTREILAKTPYDLFKEFKNLDVSTVEFQELRYLGKFSKGYNIKQEIIIEWLQEAYKYFNVHTYEDVTDIEISINSCGEISHGSLSSINIFSSIFSTENFW